MDELYKTYVVDLFTVPFYNIKFDKLIYEWNNFKNVFVKLFTELYKNLNNKNNFIKYYYIIIILYIYYTNFLKFNLSNDFNNKEIYFYIKSLNCNKEISEKLFEYSDDDSARKIIKYLNHFIYSKVKSTIKKNKILEKKKVNILTDKLISTSNTIDNFLSLNNNEFKKILSIIIYRYLSSLELGLKSYHIFYNKYFVKHKNDNSRFDYDSDNFNKFIKNIPKQKQLVDFKTSDFINRNNVYPESIINFFLKYKKDFFISSTNNIDKKIKIKNKKGGTTTEIIIEKYITISNKKSNSEIRIVLNSSHCSQYYVEFNIFQSNLSLIHFQNKCISDIDFLKKSNFFIQIDISTLVLNDPSDILDLFHYLSISFKIINNYPQNINDFISPLSFNNYYYDSFYYYFKYFKNDISSDSFIGKFIIEMVKFIYIYSYYDYFIYYKTELLELLINNVDQKNEIFTEFFNNFKKTLKIGDDLIPYPPFCDVSSDINRIIYYTFEIPNYLKLYDLCNAFVNVHDFENKNTITPIMIIMFIEEIKNNKKNNDKQSNKISKLNNTYDEIYASKLNVAFITDTK